MQESGKNVRVSCVIPAYNEEKSLPSTLAAVRDSGAVDEVIVVDDGSTDGTRAIAAAFPGVTLLVNEKNLGKSGTIAHGIEASSGEFILLLDADLLGLKAEHVAALVRPVLDGAADMAISIRENTPGWMKSVGIDFMSGERVYPRAFLLAQLGMLRSIRGFGIEVSTNRAIIREKLRVMSVYMPGVKNDFKWKKRGFWFGAWKELLLWRDLFSVISPVEFVTQNIKLSRQLVKA